MPRNPINTINTINEQDAAILPPAGVSNRQAWYTVWLLAALYVVSWLDRGILALLAQPLAASLGLDDRQLALLLGLGFALVYAIGGVALGHFVDTRNRRTVVTIGVIIWSLATILSAFSTNFEMIFLLRCGVALGEAVLMPAAISLIADLFKPAQRGLPVAFFTSIGSFMTIGAYALGAAAIGLAEAVSSDIGLTTWRTTLIIVGLPGLLLALIFAFTAKIPTRSISEALPAAEVSMAALIQYLKKRMRFMGPLLSLTGINCIYSLAIIIWLPTVLIREHGMNASEAGYLLGLVGVPAALAGNFFWQWRGLRLYHRDPEKGILRTFVLPSLCAAPCYAAGLLSDSIVLQLSGFAVGMFMGSAFNVMTPIAIQSYTPTRMRARIVSLNFLIISVLGYGLGPLAAVEIGTWVAGEGQGIRTGLITLSLISWPLLVITTLAMVRNAGKPNEL